MMHLNRWVAAAITALVGAAATLAPATVVADERTAEGAQPALQLALDRVVDAGAVGALAEVRDRRQVWRGTSGLARRGTGQPVPVHGRFRIGSTTKTLVATVVLQLVDDGRLRLDDTVERWLPGVVPGGEDITLRHLLSHTSGLFDVLRTLTLPPDPEFLDYRWRTWTASELIQRAVSNPPTFEPPGSAFSYSNTNYLLLGEVMEQATGRSYAELVERRILRPLRLRDTTLPGTDEWISGPHPHGYVPIETDEGAELVDYTRMNPSVMGAGGEAVSTTRDLNRFFSALLGGQLLPEHLLEEMRTPAIDGGRYGLGLWVATTTCGVRVYGHDGDTLSYQSWSYNTRHAHRQVTIALTPDHSADLDDVVDRFLDEVFCR